MKQLDLFELFDKMSEPLKESITKRVEVEITKIYGSTAIIVYWVDGTIEEIKQKLTDYFERVKNILDIKSYKFILFENIS